MSHLNTRDYATVPSSDNRQLLLSDSEFHRFNREASRRRVYALIAWGLFGAAVVAIVFLGVMK